jgi:hypothetical protein
MELIVIDCLLALGAALRLTRFIVADDVPGQWWIKDPIERWMHGPSGAYRRYEMLAQHREEMIRDGHDPDTLVEPMPPVVPARRVKFHRYLEGLACPYCMGVWMAGLATLSLWLAGGPGDAAEWWRYLAGFLTLAWLVGHIAARVGDTE